MSSKCFDWELNTVPLEKKAAHVFTNGQLHAAGNMNYMCVAIVVYRAFS